MLPIGLGARDSLRLEAGLCLYGHDIDETTSIRSKPGLVWSIGKRRKLAAIFPRAERLMDELSRTARKRKRVGIRLHDKAPAREGAEIVDKAGRVIGTHHQRRLRAERGCARSRWAMSKPHSPADGTELDLMVRGKARPAVAPMPFVPHRYKRSTQGV